MERREEWRVLETVTRSSVVNDRGETVAIGCGRGARQRREHAAQIVSDHNQHAALVEQRDRLATALRSLLQDYEQTYRDLTDGQFEFSGTAIRQAQRALATVEQGGETR